LDLPSAGNPPALKSSAKKRQKFLFSDGNDFSDASESDSNSNLESNSDSGYNSSRNLDTKAKYYRKIRAEFVVVGSNLANFYNETKAMIKREE